jgi:aryl-alcohol dehydrogenase-like predicted oxidoreductase
VGQRRNWSVQEKLADFAEKRGWALPQMALAWLLTRPMMATTIAGVEMPEQLEANIKALDIRFSPEEEPRQARLASLDDVFARSALVIGFLAHAVAELGSDHRLVALASQGLPNDLLRHAL